MQAAEAWKAAKAEHEAAKAKLDKARVELIALGPGTARGVRVLETKMRGSVDWRAFARAMYAGGSFVDAAEEHRRPVRKVSVVRLTRSGRQPR